MSPEALAAIEAAIALIAVQQAQGTLPWPQGEIVLWLAQERLDRAIGRLPPGDYPPGMAPKPRP